MAKNKSSKQLIIPPKRKKSSSTSDIHEEAMMDTKAKRKRKMELEEAPKQIPSDIVQADDRKQKKETKSKRKQTEHRQRVNKLEVSDTLCHPEVAHEPGEEDLSPEERRVLERKMKKILKKEKKRLKEEEESLKVKASGATASQQALDYLTCWAENHTEWKFQKTRQTWLLQHIFDFEKIPDDKFSVMLQYLEGLRGGARETTVQKALALIEESGQTPEDRSAQQRAQRAREVIQLLS
ncbi:protein cholesin [Takifugu rubripes]|uniref:protein cholesin n=1 Tax=Takifugu rubripes TaxID=31033 RepID=UPI0005D1C1D6|nr:uncharacterized protein C7orf50 homolog [Takifugu rubripes]|eukprot:XP_011602089.1 PREDICTED: uncharacterized protein C7orf50 homolog [Takifugu rubripes]